VGVPTTVDELMHHKAVLYRRNDGATSPWIIRHDEAHVEHRNVEGRILVGNAEAQVGAVLHGMGIAQLPTWLIEDYLERKELVEIVPHLSTDGLPLYLIWQTSRQLLPKVASLIKCFEEGLTIR
jgi:DNA-binding transcriptional LysR family regulator